VDTSSPLIRRDFSTKTMKYISIFFFLIYLGLTATIF